MASAPNHMMDAALCSLHLIPSFPPPHPLSRFFRPPPHLLCFHQLCISVWKREALWSNHLMSYGCVICLPFLALTLYSHWHHIGQGSFSIPLFCFHLVPPPRCGLHWHSLLLYPQELSVHCHCKANAWDSLKQTASILCRSPICG